jgi:hypothetical protein
MNRQYHWIISFVCLSSGTPMAYAQNAVPAVDVGIAEPLPSEERGWGVTGYPILFYSPETKSALGGGLALYKATPSLRPDVTELEVFGTQMKQFELNVKQTTFLVGNKYEVFGEIRLNRSPRMAFFGVAPDNPGNQREEYLDKGIVFSPHFAVQWWKDFFLGPAFRIAAFSAGDLARGGLLEQGTL